MTARDDIVEAGAKAMYERNPEPGITWAHLDRGVKVEYRRDFEAGLDGSLPLIRDALMEDIQAEEGRRLGGFSVWHAARLIEGWTP